MEQHVGPKTRFIQTYDAGTNSPRLLAAIDIAAALEAAEIAGAIADMFDKWDQKKWRDGINAKLGSLLDAVEQILSILKTLGTLLDEANERNWLVRDKIVATVIKDDFNAFMAPYAGVAPPLNSVSDQTEKLLTSLFQDSMRLMGIALQYKYAGFYVVGTMALTMLASGKFARIHRETVRVSVSRAQRFFAEALDSALSGSLSNRLVYWQNQEASKKQEGDSFIRRGGIGLSRVRERPMLAQSLGREEPPPASRTVYPWFELTGSAESGYAGSETHLDDQPLYPNFPEVYGITYGAEYSLDWRREKVLGTVNGIIRTEFLACRNNRLTMEQHVATAIAFRDAIDLALQKYPQIRP